MTAPASAPTARSPVPPVAPLPRPVPPAPAPFDQEETRRRIHQVDLIALAQRIGVSGLQRVGRDAVGCCPLPGHEDGDPSCHFYRDPGRGWFCYGCHCGGDAVTLLRAVYGWSFGQALAFLDLGDGARPTFTRLAPQGVRPAQALRVPLGEPLAIYEYGTYQVCRYVDADGRKTFRQRCPDGRGGWIWNLDGITPRLYHQGEILAAAPDVPVCITEGEKDADALGTLGYLATCNSGGAGCWPETLSSLLAGRKVVIFPDNDPAGQQHAADVAASLRPYAISITIVALPGLPDKGDVSDFLAAGWHPDAIRALVLMTRPLETVDPVTGELLTDRPADPAPPVAARLLELETQVQTLKAANALQAAYIRHIDDLLGNAQLTPGHRLVAFYTWKELTAQGATADGPPVPVQQWRVAENAGVSTDAVGRAWKALDGRAWKREAVPLTTASGTRHTQIRLAPTTDLTDHRRALASPPGKTGHRWGGVRTCHACGSAHLERVVQIRCADCGTVQAEQITPLTPDPAPPVAAQGEDVDRPQFCGTKTYLPEAELTAWLPPITEPQLAARWPGDLIDTRRAAAVLIARAAHDRRQPPVLLEEPPHPADTDLCFTPDAEGPPLGPEQSAAAPAGRAPPQGPG